MGIGLRERSYFELEIEGHGWERKRLGAKEREESWGGL